MPERVQNHVEAARRWRLGGSVHDWLADDVEQPRGYGHCVWPHIPHESVGADYDELLDTVAAVYAADDPSAVADTYAFTRILENDRVRAWR
jgi:hypothetical protein